MLPPLNFHQDKMNVLICKGAKVKFEQLSKLFEEASCPTKLTTWQLMKHLAFKMVLTSGTTAVLRFLCRFSSLKITSFFDQFSRVKMSTELGRATASAENF